jgi:hypothetical protein
VPSRRVVSNVKIFIMHRNQKSGVRSQKSEGSEPF